MAMNRRPLPPLDACTTGQTSKNERARDSSKQIYFTRGAWRLKILHLQAAQRSRSRQRALPAGCDDDDEQEDDDDEQDDDDDEQKDDDDSPSSGSRHSRGQTRHGSINKHL